jgi:uncharacterized protein YbaR (Trm112 family)
MSEVVEEQSVVLLSLTCPICGGRMQLHHFTYAGERVLVCRGCGAELVLKARK